MSALEASAAAPHPLPPATDPVLLLMSARRFAKFAVATYTAVACLRGRRAWFSFGRGGLGQPLATPFDDDVADAVVSNESAIVRASFVPPVSSSSSENISATAALLASKFSTLTAEGATAGLFKPTTTAGVAERSTSGGDGRARTTGAMLGTRVRRMAGV